MPHARNSRSSCSSLRILGDAGAGCGSWWPGPQLLLVLVPLALLLALLQPASQLLWHLLQHSDLWLQLGLS